MFPDIPTFKELGYDFTNEAMFVIAAPKGTPPSIVNKLDDAFRKAMDDPEFLAIMKKLEIEVIMLFHNDFISTCKRVNPALLFLDKAKEEQDGSHQLND